MIIINPPVVPNDELCYMSFEESVLVQKINTAFGKVAAVRVTRAFAKCGLKSAVEYVNSLKD